MQPWRRIRPTGSKRQQYSTSPDFPADATTSTTLARASCASARLTCAGGDCDVPGGYQVLYDAPTFKEWAKTQVCRFSQCVLRKNEECWTDEQVRTDNNFPISMLAFKPKNTCWVFTREFWTPIGAVNHILNGREGPPRRVNLEPVVDRMRNTIKIHGRGRLTGF